MGIFKKKQEVRAETEEGTENFSDDLLRAVISASQINRNNAMQIPAVSACVNLMSYIVSSIPIKLYKQDGDQCIEIVDDPRVNILNHETGDTLSATQFWRAMITDYYLGKGAYAYINKSGNSIESIHYIENSRWTTVENTDPIFKSYKVMVNGTEYWPYEFFKILRHTSNGMKSQSICEENSTILQATYMSLIFEKLITAKGGNKKGFLESASTIPDAMRKTLKQDWKDFYSNNESSDSVMILGGGINFHETSATSAELQLNEQKVTNTGQISMLFNIPQTIVCGLSSGTSDKDIEDFIKFAVTPLLNDIECSADRDLLLESEKEYRSDFKQKGKGRYYFAFDTKELTRGSIKERFDAYKTAKETGWLGTNEIRNMEDMEEIPNFNVVSMSLADVIYNIDTGTYYVPNTKQITNGTDSTKKEGEDDGSGNQN